MLCCPMNGLHCLSRRENYDIRRENYDIQDYFERVATVEKAKIAVSEGICNRGIVKKGLYREITAVCQFVVRIVIPFVEQ